MRRLTGGRHRLVRKAAIRSGVGLTHRAAAGTVRMFETLAAGGAEVDPNRFDLDGLAGSAASSTG